MIETLTDIISLLFSQQTSNLLSKSTVLRHSECSEQTDGQAVTMCNCYDAGRNCNRIAGSGGIPTAQAAGRSLTYSRDARPSIIQARAFSSVRAATRSSQMTLERTC